MSYLIIGLSFGIGVLVSFLLFVNNIIKFKKKCNDFEYNNKVLESRISKLQKKIVRYKNEFHDKYVDDGYDAY